MVIVSIKSIVCATGVQLAAFVCWVACGFCCTLAVACRAATGFRRVCAVCAVGWS